ncbi:hypothetical protein ACJO5Y_18460 [Marinobacter sp. GN3S48]|uniref:hypothetical protein n=1 Tax=Marinobacter sp. GN3S48 TaxID=3382302 RepID=UPI00387B61E6
MRLHTLLLVASLAGSALCRPVVAELALPVTPLANPELAELRGGFVLDNLEIAIGLEQIVSVNGDTMVVNRLNIPNLNQSVHGGVVEHQLETVLQVVGPNQQAGPRVSGNLSDSSGWMTMIQNNLDSTVIQNVQQLNIELNNIGRGVQLPAQLNDHLLQFLGR